MGDTIQGQVRATSYHPTGEHHARRADAELPAGPDAAWDAPGFGSGGAEEQLIPAWGRPDDRRSHQSYSVSLIFG